MPANKKKIKKKTVNQKKAHDNMFLLITLILIAGIVPLIVYLKVFTLSDVEKLYTGKNDPGTDLFSFYKMAFLLLFSASGLLLFLFKSRDNLFDNHRRSYYIVNFLKYSDSKKAKFLGFSRFSYDNLYSLFF